MNKSSRSIGVFAGLLLVSVAGLAWFYSQRAVPASPAPASLTPNSSVTEPSPAEIPDSPEAVAPAAQAANTPAPETAPVESHRIYFRWTLPDAHYGQLAYLDYPTASAPRFVDALSCEVVHFTAGTGSCLQAKRGVVTRYLAAIFDSGYRSVQQVALNGIPSRTRVAPNGRIAAVTVFVTGHGYDSVDFTTQTLLVNTATGATLADLEEFEVTRDGQRFHAEDFNFWGVTFGHDSDRFYATVSSNRKHYLIEGSVSGRSAQVIHDNVECPSLSPDGKRVAYKKRLPGDKVVWQLHILNLANRQETALAEKRSVDDQLEWLDADHVLYSLPHGSSPSPTTDVWTAAADGSGKPKLLIPNAYSPAVER